MLQLLERELSVLASIRAGNRKHQEIVADTGLRLPQVRHAAHWMQRNGLIWWDLGFGYRVTETGLTALQRYEFAGKA